MGLRSWWDSMTGREAASSQAVDLPRPPTSAELMQALDVIETDIDARAAAGSLSPIISARVAEIADTARQVIPRLDQLGGASRDAHSVMATVTSYLPEALGTYIRLPRDYADHRPVAAGKTSLMVLVDQLDLLKRTLDKILDAATRRDVEALIAHGKFLADKFGHSADGGELGLGEAP